MNHKEILKRAWHILWNYKALWVFGFILAVTTISSSSSNAANSVSNSGPSSNNQPPPEYMGESFYEGWEEVEEGFDLFFNEGIRTDIVNTFFAIAIGIGCLDHLPLYERDGPDPYGESL
jgi:hypothetical protein